MKCKCNIQCSKVSSNKKIWTVIKLFVHCTVISLQGLNFTVVMHISIRANLDMEVKLALVHGCEGSFLAVNLHHNTNTKVIRYNRPRAGVNHFLSVLVQAA